jgi:hypothetical protein
VPLPLSVAVSAAIRALLCMGGGLVVADHAPPIVLQAQQAAAGAADAMRGADL